MARGLSDLFADLAPVTPSPQSQSDTSVVSSLPQPLKSHSTTNPHLQQLTSVSNFTFTFKKDLLNKIKERHTQNEVEMQRFVTAFNTETPCAVFRIAPQSKLKIISCNSSAEHKCFAARKMSTLQRNTFDQYFPYFISFSSDTEISLIDSIHARYLDCGVKRGCRVVRIFNKTFMEEFFTQKKLVYAMWREIEGSVWNNETIVDLGCGNEDDSSTVHQIRIAFQCLPVFSDDEDTITFVKRHILELHDKVSKVIRRDTSKQCVLQESPLTSITAGVVAKSTHDYSSTQEQNEPEIPNTPPLVGIPHNVNPVVKMVAQEEAG